MAANERTVSEERAKATPRRRLSQTMCAPIKEAFQGKESGRRNEWDSPFIGHSVQRPSRTTHAPVVNSYSSHQKYKRIATDRNETGGAPKAVAAELRELRQLGADEGPAAAGFSFFPAASGGASCIAPGKKGFIRAQRGARSWLH